MRKIIVYTDGGAISNPGPAAIAFLICNEKDQVLKKYSQKLEGNLTNNQAEYLAAIFALKKIKALFGKKLSKQNEVEIRTDSELLVNQMQGKYKILEKELKELFIELWNLRLDFKKVVFKKIPREKNKEADKLVKEILKT
jgi:ribonuclease HI